MNTFFVRTKLQCLIAMKIQKQCLNASKYAVVFIYKDNINEDSSTVYEHYKEFEKNSTMACHIVLGGSFTKTLNKLLLIMNLTALSGGRCFLACIDSLPIALVLRVCPWVRYETFDDGLANILISSKYYQGRLSVRSGWRQFIAGALFPAGWTTSMRQRTRAHYTIFSSHENIVENSRLQFLNWDWESLLVASDIEMLDVNASIIALGTCDSDYPDPELVRSLSLDLARMADLYIPHPRETLVPNEKSVKLLKSPAEAALIHLAKRRKIKVFHFNSTVAYALEHIENIDFENLTNPIDRSLKIEI